MPKAYSYLRFSTPEQEHGDSFRRQSDLARKYAALNDLELDDTLNYVDQGISAFHGLNAQIGALKKFLEHIESGLIAKGSYLLVESLDRISRDRILVALRIFLRIIRSGITIVTLIDNRKHNKEIVNANPTELLISLLVMMRAREESATKSKRLKAAWEEKRTNMRSKILTRHVPSWIKVNEQDKFEVIKEKAKIVKKIFKMASKGLSPYQITRFLNKNKVPTLGPAEYWKYEMVYGLLGNPAVTGTINLNTQVNLNGKDKSIPLMRVEQYYPTIISEKDFSKISELRPRRRRAKAFEVKNIFGYLAKCPRCGSGMSKRELKGVTALACVRAQNGPDCEAKYINYGKLERAFSEKIDQISPPEDNKEYESLKLKLNYVKQELKSSNLDKKRINLLLRRLFRRVIVDYINGKLIFEWVAGEKQSIIYYQNG